MWRALLWITAIIFGIWSHSAVVAAGSFGLFFDADASTCSVSQPPMTAGTFYVIGILGGPEADLGGATLKIDGFPAEWFTNPPQANPGTIVVGRPFEDGVLVIFQQCQLGNDGHVFMFSITYFATSLVTNHHFRVAGHQKTTPQCPTWIHCDNRNNCVAGGEAIINPMGQGCTVGVRPSTWGQVKNLYAS